MWDVAFQLLHAGSSVVLDWNFWSRERRAEARRRAEEAEFGVRLHWLDLPIELVIGRARNRMAANPPHVHRITEADVRNFATIFEPPGVDEGLPITVHGACGTTLPPSC